MADKPVRLTLLGGFEVSIDRRPTPLIWSAQRLLAFVALHDRPVARTQAAGALWPATTPLRAGANLRTSLWRVRRPGGSLIDVVGHHLVLSPDVAVDVRQATGHAERLLAGDDSDELATPAIRADLAAELLPTWYDDDWVLVRRERYHQLRLHALEAMCARLTAHGRHGEAVDTAVTAVRADPLRETAHRVLIEAHLAAGNRAEALRQYRDCRRVLRDELGLEPTAALRDLFDAEPAAEPLAAANRMLV